MKTIYILTCITLALSVLPSTSSAENLDNTLYARYLCRSRTDGFKTSVPGSCSQYYECNNGRTQLRTCPYFYNFESGICVDTNPGCVETHKVAPSCSGPCCGISNGYAVNTNNQQIYYQCKDNCIVSTHTCTGDQEFNVVKSKCDISGSCRNCGGSATTVKPPCGTTTTCYTPTTTPCKSTTTSCTTPSTITRTRTKTISTPNTKTTTCSTTPSTRTQTGTITIPTPGTKTTTCSTTPSTITGTGTITRTIPTPSTKTTTCSTTPSTITETGTITIPTPGTKTTTCSTTTCSTTPSTITGTGTITRTIPTPSTKTTTCSTTPSTITETGTITLPTPGTKTTTCSTTTCSTTPSTITETGTITISTPCTTTTTCTTKCSTAPTPCAITTAAPCDPADDSPNSAHIPGIVKPPQTLQTNIDLYMRYVCRDKPNNFMLASLKSCNQYYICNNGLAIPVTCGDKYFNALKGICDLPENTGCIRSRN